MNSKIHILLVEDEAITAQCMKLELQDMGYSVDAVSTGEKAIESAQQNQPAIVLMDVHLAGQMDGVDAMRKIKELDDIPVIFMTGYGDESVRGFSDEFNILGILIKPINTEEIKNIIESYTS